MIQEEKETTDVESKKNNELLFILFNSFLGKLADCCRISGGYFNTNILQCLYELAPLSPRGVVPCKGLKSRFRTSSEHSRTFVVPFRVLRSSMTEDHLYTKSFFIIGTSEGKGGGTTPTKQSLGAFLGYFSRFSMSTPVLGDPGTLSSPEVTLLLVGTKNHDLWSGPTSLRF